MSKHHEGLDRRKWERVSRLAKIRDRFRCCACKRFGRVETDHVVPLHLGGAKYALANLQTLCVHCHAIKTAEENRRARMKEMSPAQRAWGALVQELMV